MNKNSRAKKKAPVARPRAILVVGAPRSGTSAAAQVLSRLGVHFGDPARFVDPEKHTHNPIFFELQSLNDLNDALLASIGVNFGDFDYFPVPGELQLSDEIRQAFEAQAEALLAEEFGSRRLIGLKDPRFVFTLPFWEALFKTRGYEVSFVYVTRAIRSIARSNAKVNRCSEMHNDRLAWLCLHLCAAQLLVHEPALLDFDRLVAEPDAVVSELARRLKLRVTTELSHGIDPTLKHETEVQHFTPADVSAMAQQYLQWRDELQRFGWLELIERRRSEVRGLVRSNQALTEEVAATRVDIQRLDLRLQAAMAPLASELRSGFERIADVMAQDEEEKSFSRAIIQKRISDLEGAVFSERAETARLLAENAELRTSLERMQPGRRPSP